MIMETLSNETCLLLIENFIEISIIPFPGGVNIYARKGIASTDPTWVSKTELESSNINQVDRVVNLHIKAVLEVYKLQKQRGY